MASTTKYLSKPFTLRTSKIIDSIEVYYGSHQTVFQDAFRDYTTGLKKAIRESPLYIFTDMICSYLILDPSDISSMTSDHEILWRIVTNSILSRFDVTLHPVLEDVIKYKPHSASDFNTRVMSKIRRLYAPNDVAVRAMILYNRYCRYENKYIAKYTLGISYDYSTNIVTPKRIALISNEVVIAEMYIVGPQMESLSAKPKITCYNHAAGSRTELTVTGHTYKHTDISEYNDTRSLSIIYSINDGNNKEEFMSQYIGKNKGTVLNPDKQDIEEDFDKYYE